MAADLHLDRQPNNFGIVRLMLAFAVIVSHSPELVDGDRSRELLSRTFGTASFGETAVAGFFIVSGYLISKSFIQGSSTFGYFLKRIARIFPGFALAFCFSVLVGALVSGQSDWSFSIFFELTKQLITLQIPTVEGAFEDLPYPTVNGSLWTIAYEFRCYIAVAVFGYFGLYSPSLRWVFLAMTVLLVVGDTIGVANGVTWPFPNLLGTAEYSLKFFAFFCVGVCHTLFAGLFRYTAKGAALSCVLLFLLMFSEVLNRYATAVFGGYILLWFATTVKQWKPVAWTDRVDLSYGLYLFAWPIQNLIIWNYREINPWILCMAATGIGLTLAGFSFFCVERPFQEAVKNWLAVKNLKTTQCKRAFKKPSSL